MSYREVNQYGQTLRKDPYFQATTKISKNSKQQDAQSILKVTVKYLGSHVAIVVFFLRHYCTCVSAILYFVHYFLSLYISGLIQRCCFIKYILTITLFSHGQAKITVSAHFFRFIHYHSCLFVYEMREHLTEKTAFIIITYLLFYIMRVF